MEKRKTWALSVILMMSVIGCNVSEDEITAYRAESVEQMLAYLEVPQEDWGRYEDSINRRGHSPAEEDYDFINRLINVRTVDDYLSLVCGESKEQLLTTERGQTYLGKIENAINNESFPYIPYDSRVRTKAIWVVQNYDMDISRHVDFAVTPTHTLIYLTYNKEKKALLGSTLFVVKKGTTLALVSDVSSEYSVRMQQSVSDLKAMHTALKQYVVEHADKLPAEIKQLEGYFEDSSAYQRLLDSAVYVGQGKQITDPDDTVIAYVGVLGDEEIRNFNLLLSGMISSQSKSTEKMEVAP